MGSWVPHWGSCSVEFNYQNTTISWMWYEIQDCVLELFTLSVTFFVWSSGGLVFPPMLGRKLGLSCDIGWLLWIVILTPMGKMSLTCATVRRLHFRCFMYIQGMCEPSPNSWKQTMDFTVSFRRFSNTFAPKQWLSWSYYVLAEAALDVVKSQSACCTFIYCRTLSAVT